ncbi:M20 family metallopeptidase [uncultured Friedmanniella sp.]|uniref:M20 family metallopeptidase n=1 Tax=uncultured Friedmanniella sp. TaxID=335381 RepID=UPI0035CB23D0
MNPTLTRSAELVRAFSAEVADQVVGRCAALVAAPSVNPPGDTREMADLVQAALRTAGLDARQESAVPSMPSVISELDSGRPGPHLVLNVHLDTMPPGDESRWTVPVWELSRVDGRLHGLGMGNMKGAVAAMLSTVELLHRAREQWCGRITFLAVSDEVVFGENGSAHLLRQHPDYAGDALICGEGPGFRRLAVAEKGVLWLRLSAHADGGHSSAVTRDASAVSRLSRALVAVDDLNGREVALPPELAAHWSGAVARELTLSVNAGTVAGGTFVGQIATEAAAELDLRLPPGLSADSAEQLVREAVAGVAGTEGQPVEVSRIKGWDANWTDPTSTVARAWGLATAELRGVGPTLAVRLPASDASRWRQRGVPALCYGPQPSWSAGVDDYAEESEVLGCVGLYTLTALTFLQRSPA